MQNKIIINAFITVFQASISVSVCLYVCLFISIALCMSVCLFLSIALCLHVCLSVLHVSLCLSHYLTLSHCMSHCLSVYLFLFVCLCQSIYLSLSLFVCLSLSPSLPPSLSLSLSQCQVVGIHWFIQIYSVVVGMLCQNYT